MSKKGLVFNDGVKHKRMFWKTRTMDLGLKELSERRQNTLIFLLSLSNLLYILMIASLQENVSKLPTDVSLLQVPAWQRKAKKWIWRKK